MTNDQFKYFKIAKELNKKHHDDLVEKQWHFRGNCNSYSLISLSREMPEIGLSGLKSANLDFEKKAVKMNEKLNGKLGRKTPEKELQAWIIARALDNDNKLPFGKNLTFLTSELAITSDVKGKKSRVVNDILAIDDQDTLWVVELKSARDQKRLKAQVAGFTHLIQERPDFFNDLVCLLSESGHKYFKEVRGMVVWPDAGFPRNDWGGIEEIRYQSQADFLFVDKSGKG